MARKLGPYNFGVLNYAIALTGLFSIIATMTVDEFVIRQLVHEPGERNRFLGNFFMLRVVLFLLMALALGVTLSLINATPEVKWLCVIIASGYFGFLAQGCGLYFQAAVESKYVAIPGLISCLVCSFMRLAAAWFDWPLAVFALAEASISIVQFWGCFVFYWRRVETPFHWDWNWGEIWTLLRTALPLAICGVFSLVYARTDQLMIEYFLGPEAVGYYALAARFTENWAIVSGMLCVCFFPAVAMASKVSPEMYRKQMHRLYFLVFWCMVVASMLTIAFDWPVIYLFFGREYLPTVPVLNVFVWTLLGGALLNVFCQWAINEKRIPMIAWAFGVGAVINVVLNPFLIKLTGINGAAVSSLISMPLGLVLSLLWTSSGRMHLKLMASSIVKLPSFKLG